MRRLSKSVVGTALAVVVASAIQSQVALAETEGAPVVGLELGAAVPIGKFKDTADLGGSAGAYGGYHWQFNETVGLSLLANPEFSFFPSDHPTNPLSGQESDSDVVIVMGLNAGPRLTIGGEEAHVFIDGRGGYFRDLSGPLNESGPGYNVGGGAGFTIAPNTSLTLFGRFNEALSFRAFRGSSKNLRFVTAGIGIEHRFAAPPPAPAAAPPPAPPPAPAAPMKKRIILRGVNFDFDKSNIRADARPVLDEAIDTLKEYGDIRVSVEGHTDSRGTDAYNQGLSIRRANSVADYLEDGGISRSRMEISGFGESRPVASNDTDDGRAQNRRVELNVIE
jgi:outer membrane protein OmpA-like peptidoglycan-associated protein